MVIMGHSPGRPAVLHRGGVVLPTLFNVAVDSAVLYWIFLMVEDEAVIQDGLVHEVGCILEVFYAYYGILVSRDPE